MASEFDVLKPVQSSMFSRAGYDDKTWTLVLEFKSTSEIRAYKNVAPEVADEALKAKSLGQWWNQNIRGNADWESELLGADPSVHVPVKAVPEKTSPEMEVMDEDIRRVEPGWNGKTITPAAAEAVHQFGVTEFDPNTGHRPNSDMNDDGTVKVSAMTTQTQGEIMPAWQTPETAGEALELMEKHSTEIAAIISANQQKGQQAMALKVTNAETRVQISEVLDQLVTTKDTTVKLLDPFRKVLHEAYTYAGGKVKAATDPIDNAIMFVKQSIIVWDREQERIRQEQVRQAREAAEAESRRQQQAEQERLTLAEVGDALEQGDTQRAETLFDKPVEVPRPYVAPEYIPPSAPAIKGQSGRQNWKVVEEELDLIAFLRAVKEDKFPLDQAANLVEFNIPALNGLAKSLKTAFNVPGARAEDQGSLSVRRKK